MEKLIESRGQYDELRYKVGEELRTISPNISPAYTQSPWWIHEGSGADEIDRATAEHYHFPYIETKDGRFYQCTGQPAQPFLYPALKNNEDRITEIIGEELKKQL